MKVLLIQPDFRRQESDPQQLASHLLPSYSLVMLAQILERDGHEATVLDGFSNWVITGRGKENDLAQGLETVLKKDKFDLIGISVYNAIRKEAVELARIAKELAPAAKIIMGGPNPTRLWQIMLKEYEGLVDFMVLGGADISLPALAKALETGAPFSEIAGLAWKNETGEIVSSSKPVFNIDLSTEPPVKFDSYLKGLGQTKPDRAYMVASRGCKFHCNFCSQVWKKALFHPVARAIEEARHLVEDVGVSELVFYDDCLGLDPKHSSDIFNAMAKFKRRAKLIGISHIQLLNPLWLGPFKDAGGEALLLGIESGNLKLRRKMNKHMEDKEVCQGVESLRNIGFKLGIYIMVGFPSEEIAQLSSTCRLMEKIAPEQVIAGVYDIKPGDMMIEWGLKSLAVQEHDFLDLDRRIINYMSEEELEAAVGMADYFETRFTSQPLLKDHDPVWWVRGFDAEKRARLRKKAEESLNKCQN